MLARLVGALVDGVFQLLVRRFADYEAKDRVLAAQPAVAGAFIAAIGGKLDLGNLVGPSGEHAHGPASLAGLRGEP